MRLPAKGRGVVRLLAAGSFAAAFGLGGGQQLHLGHGAPVALAQTGCVLGSPLRPVQHVIYIQFDNVHFTRDNPNVPSDLEQMPHLLNFITQNGVLSPNHHTPLIAHTATDILTSLTGLYGDRMGVPVSNSYRVFNPNGSSDGASSFTYWTDPVNDFSSSTPSDTSYNMVTTGGANTPAPWVPYTRAGCNVGAVATANMEFENTGSDVTTVYGANSPQAQEAKANGDQAYADFVGVAVHCARGAAVCSSANGGRPDVLPSEPGGYSGFNALFGHKYVAPVINPNGTGTSLADLNGQTITNADSSLVGFPGFDPTAAQSLAYVADMQEHGVPVTYAYIADAHDNHVADKAYGPGEAGYVAQLKSYDSAFATFFNRLTQDGITPQNSLFVFTADENDHFAGGAPNNPGCDGVTTPCTYTNIGEVNTNLTGLLATEKGVTTPFGVHADSAPNVYINGNPSFTAPVTRAFERAAGGLTATNPIRNVSENITNYLADSTEMSLLHMMSPDMARNPTLTIFAKPDYYLYGGKTNCASACVAENPQFAWNHGDVSPDINTTWLGLVGPGVRPLGVNGSTWSDHTDIRPTMLELLGLRDDYQSDGRVLFEDLDPAFLPVLARMHASTLQALAQEYKRINAPVGAFGIASLKASTGALESNTPDDVTFTSVEARLQMLTSQRNAIASRMAAVLNGVEFGGQVLNETQARLLIAQGELVFQQMDRLAVSVI